MKIMSILKGMVKYLLTDILVVILIAIFPLWILSHDYFVDWDVLRYATDVKIYKQGDAHFSYAHNLIKTFMYCTAVAAEKVTKKFDPLYGAKILTFVFSLISSFFIFLSVERVSNKTILSFLAALFWFLIPVNYYHILICEDNVWVNAFNSICIYLVIYMLSENLHNTRKAYIVTCLCGLFISIGINFHQQIVPLFYLILLTCIFLFKENKKRILSILYFMIMYSTASFIQNYMAFGKFNIIESFKRLIFQPYAKVFPHLWFFSSGDSLYQWSVKISDGLKKSFFTGETEIPFFLFILLPVAFVAIFYIIKDARLEKNNFLAIFIFLIAAIFVHVPHTLVYEPWNPERWDIVNPSLVIMLFLSVYIVSIKYKFKNKALLFFYTIIVIFSCFTAVQNYKFIKKIAYWSEHGIPRSNFNSVLSYLGKVDSLSKNDIVLLDETTRWFLFDEMVTYNFPDIHVITLSDTLNIVYSSSEQQHWNKKYNKKYFFANTFGNKRIFHVMPSVAENIKKADVHFTEMNKFYEIKLY